MKIVRPDELPASYFDYIEAPELSVVKEIIAAVREDGDAAVKQYTEQFDKVRVDELILEPSALKEAYQALDNDTVEAIQTVAENIRCFAEVQRNALSDFEVELIPGVKTGQRTIPIERVGVYVPGGSFPLVSTLLMGAVPARVAGVKDVVVCSPPTHDGSIHPAILVAADVAGVDAVWQVGGVQGIAALAYGTETLQAVDKIVGPGNKYVAQAKKEVFGVVGIDLIAGPTEVCIIADDSADVEILAADLLAQAEHDIDAIPLLVTTSSTIAAAVREEVARQLPELATAAIARQSIEQNGYIVVTDSLEDAVNLVNRKAPEHLEVILQDPAPAVERLINYGSLFIGELSAEVLGDYSSGINHTLPTNTTARYRGGLSVFDFLRIHTVLRVESEGLATIGPAAEKMARAEGLDGHRRSIAIRREKFLE